jgi:DNA processing protein
MQISKLSSNDTQFPDTLRELEICPIGVPENIYHYGKLPDPDEVVIAIVGTRSMTQYGKNITYQLASTLAKAGVTIVSGLARGIDGIAHRAALDAGGRTIAVLGSSLDKENIYPIEHQAMAREILATGGALISEYAPGTPTQKWFFPERNRIIAALSRIVIVTESGPKGGALITAARAKELGRTVMAVPGNISSKYSSGPHQLIQAGAIPVFSIADIFNDLGYHVRQAIPVPAQSPDEAKLMKLIGNGQQTSDELIEASGFTAAQFANIISLMEITGKVRNMGAGNWVVR